jgi:hypothetical protein
MLQLKVVGWARGLPVQFSGPLDIYTEIPYSQGSEGGRTHYQPHERDASMRIWTPWSPSGKKIRGGFEV